MSLRTFHLVFILLVIMSAEMFGMRELWFFQRTHDLADLALGVLSLIGGLGMSLYALLLVRKLDAAGIT